MKKLISISLSAVCVSIMMFVMYQANKPLPVIEMNEAETHQVIMQTATVPCVDALNVGSGPQRARICVEDGSASCKYKSYTNKIGTGTCTFSSCGGGGTDPEVNEN